MRTRPLLATLAASTLAVAGCGGAADTTVGGSASGSASATGSASGIAAEECPSPGDGVHVELDEWSVAPETQELTAGEVTFVADNVGEEPHELVVVRADSVDALPVDEHGVLDEGGLPEGDFLGEIEPFPSGASCAGEFTLEAGTYVLLCNIAETEQSGELESHLAEGMATTITVTEGDA